MILTMLSVCGFEKGFSESCCNCLQVRRLKEREKKNFSKVFWKANGAAGGKTNQSRGLGQFSVQVLFCLLCFQPFLFPKETNISTTASEWHVVSVLRNLCYEFLLLLFASGSVTLVTTTSLIFSY